jgi:hypothetical protein
MAVTKISRRVHDPTEDCWEYHCAMHDVDEWLVPGAKYTYVIRCGECGHLYDSKFALSWAFFKELWPAMRKTPYQDRVPLLTRLGNAIRKADDITFCPLCTHDF